jgi:hypothetical protein
LREIAESSSSAYVARETKSGDELSRKKTREEGKKKIEGRREIRAGSSVRREESRKRELRCRGQG